MSTYTTIEGREIEYREPTGELAAFLDRLRAAVDDSSVSASQFLALACGPENPILDKSVIPGVPMVTKAVAADPIHRIICDLVGRKDIALGRLDPATAFAGYTVDVPTAAKQLGITGQAVRQAIETYKLAGFYRNGQWWLHPTSLASFQRGESGRLKKAGKQATPPVEVVMGNESGKSLSIRVEGVDDLGGERTGTCTRATLPEGWTQAVVKATGEGGAVYVIEPNGELAEIVHGGLSVRGGFWVVEQVSNPKKAQARWKEFKAAMESV